jgi:HSP20 family protein
MTSSLKPPSTRDVWSFPAFGRMVEDLLNSPSATPGGRILRPAMDVEEDDNQIVVRLELAGIAKEDVTLTLEDGVLTITGEKKSDRKVDEKNYHLVERSFGTFQRTLTLPSGVDSEHASATFTDGVLVIAVPKAEAAKPRKLEIK